MYWKPLLAAAFLSGLPAINAAPASVQNEEAQGVDRLTTEKRLVRERARARIDANMAGGDKARAKADAALAAAEGEFGLLDADQMHQGPYQPIGVVCFTPHGQSPAPLAQFGLGDNITPEIGKLGSFARAYNQALVERADYPHSDLCRSNIGERHDPYDPLLFTRPARQVSAKPRDLFQAARRGSVRDVRALLNPDSVNQVDGLGMTALSWAVARNNGPAINALLSAGANPWLGVEYGKTAVFWAAALGRRAEFERFVKMPGRPSDFGGWTSTYVTAAVAGGNNAILSHMLAEPNDGVRLEFLHRPLPSAEVFELVLKHQPHLAYELLFLAMHFSDQRLDLVQLALTHGANPNSVRSYESPLTKASNGIGQASVEIVDMLLKAGADPNLDPHRRRPLWCAVGMLTLDDEVGEGDARAKAIFHRLVAAGADLNLPDWQGRPPVWVLLFPRASAHPELDASFVTPELLKMLVDNGMDVNALWNGKRVLPLVEAQAGKDSELAVTLRGLGART